MTDNPVSERERFEAEQKLKQDELAIKEREIAVQEFQAKRAEGFIVRLGPIGLGIFAAAIGLIGNLVTTSLQGISQRELERTKSEALLVVELAKSGDLERAQKNMQGFIKMGFLRDPNGYLSTALENKENVPFLPPNAISLLTPNEAQALSQLTPTQEYALSQIQDPKEREKMRIQFNLQNQSEINQLITDDRKVKHNLNQIINRHIQP
jgi:hypothetical protein